MQLHQSAFLIAVVLGAGCGGSQKDVAVEGNDVELTKLAGDWQGTYEGTESGRSGSVQFSLQLGRHVAEGQVIMSGSTPLKIEFVAFKGGQVKGTIAPYTDPNCSCQVQTSFLGTAAGDHVSGTFETQVGKTGQTQTGTWNVTRSSK